MDAVVELIVPTRTKNEIGCYTSDSPQSPRTVFCEIYSVSQNEFYSGAQKGLRPEYRVEMQAVNYQGERYVNYNNEKYQIIRTFHREEDDMMELYIGR